MQSKLLPVFLAKFDKRTIEIWMVAFEPNWGGSVLAGEVGSVYSEITGPV